MFPLNGIRVLEVAEQSFVPSCGAVLAEWGADVVKVERPTGDPLRAVVASGLVARTGDFDYLFEQMNHGKRGISIDLRSEAGRDVLDRLVARADVFLTNFLPSACTKLRLQPDDLFAVNPQLVYARGHGQGSHGPEADVGGYDAVSFFSRGGIAHMLTEVGSESLVRQRPAQGDLTGGMFLAGGVAAALLQRERSGSGGIVVDCSLLSSGVWTLSPDLVAASVLGAEPERIDPMRLPNPLIGTYRTADDRWLMLTMLDLGAWWTTVAEVVGREDWTGLAVEDVVAAAEDLRRELQDCFATATLEEWEERLRARECVFARVSNPVDVLADPQVVANGYMPGHPLHPDAKLVANPIRFDDTTVEVACAAPELGAQTDDVLAEAGLDGAAIAALRDGGAVR